MNGCPGCLKSGSETFCAGCRKRLFDGRRIPSVLSFSRPDYNSAKRSMTSGRLSISGIQTKISIVLRDGRLAMVESGGQFILKPIPHGEFQRLEIMPINEHLTMQIARQVFKLEVAENALVCFEDGETAYLVRRFDVNADGSKRLQEDFAQISQRSEETHGRNYKYDFSYEEIGDLIRKHVAAYVVDLERYFRLVLFNYLVHNGDAHVKNFSLLRFDDTGEYRLAPAYDLLNTRMHMPNETRCALDLFKDDFATESFQTNAFYAYDDFLEFARRLGLVEKRARRFLWNFTEQKEDVVSMIDRSRLPEDCKRLYKDHVSDSIRALSHSHASG